MNFVKVNKPQVPRLGDRSSIVKIIKSQCNGSEWPRKDNATFFGTLDVGERDG